MYFFYDSSQHFRPQPALGSVVDGSNLSGILCWSISKTGSPTTPASADDSTQPSSCTKRLPQRQRMAHSRQLYHKLGHKTTRIFDNATAYQDAVNGLNEWTLLRLSTRLHRRRLVSHAATLILDRKYRQPPALTVPALHAYSMSIDGPSGLSSARTSRIRRCTAP